MKLKEIISSSSQKIWEDIVKCGSLTEAKDSDRYNWTVEAIIYPGNNYFANWLSKKGIGERKINAHGGGYRLPVKSVHPNDSYDVCEKIVRSLSKHNITAVIETRKY